MKLHTTDDLTLVTNFLRHHVLRSHMYHYERELLAAVDRRCNDWTLLPLLRHVYNWAYQAKRERTLAEHEAAVLAATVRIFDTISADSAAVRSERALLCFKR